mmetsp:Transcript_15407/g.22636  ORF Transcript_15407/g.22636 Transcript_15407/m.22636 type:complete len:81 (+) Transcript_15407:349-591(+)
MSIFSDLMRKSSAKSQSAPVESMGGQIVLESPMETLSPDPATANATTSLATRDGFSLQLGQLHDWLRRSAPHSSRIEIVV